MATNEGGPFLNLTQRARDDLLHLAHLGTQLEGVVEGVRDLPMGTGLSEAASKVAEAAGIGVEDASRVLLTLQNLRSLKVRLGQTSAQVVEAAAATLASPRRVPRKDGKEDSDAWTAAGPAVTTLLELLQDDHPLVVAWKADELSREHQNLFLGARLLTDLRPVFNGAGDRVHQSLVIQTLLIDYQDGTDVRRLALGLDAHDVAHLRRLCERAELKAATLKRSRRSVNWFTAIVGEEESPTIGAGE